MAAATTQHTPLLSQHTSNSYRSIFINDEDEDKEEEQKYSDGGDIKSDDEPTWLFNDHENEINRPLFREDPSQYPGWKVRETKNGPAIGPDYGPHPNRLSDFALSVICVAELAMNVWITLIWYNKGMMTPFWISVGIHICVEMGYLLVWASTLLTGCMEGCLTFMLILLALPLTPLAPIVCVLTAIRPSEYTVIRYMGFFWDLIIKTIPELVLQIVVFFYYIRHNEVVNVVSIIVGVLSVWFKYQLFQNPELGNKERPCSLTGSFKLISNVTDIISVSAILIWVFFSPENNGTLTPLGWLMIHQVLFIALPIVIFPLSLILLAGIVSFFVSLPLGSCPVCSACFNSDVLPYGPFYLILMLPSIEFPCYSRVAWYFGDSRTRFTLNGEAKHFWDNAMDFIDSADGWSDLKLRVIVLNEVLLQICVHNSYELKRVLSEHRHNDYENVGWSDLYRRMPPAKDKELDPMFSDWVDTSIMSSCMKQFYDTQHRFIVWFLRAYDEYVIGSLKWFTTVINVVFIWVALLVIPWNVSDDSLQLTAAVMLIGMQIVWLVSLISIIRDQWPLWCILGEEREVSLTIWDRPDSSKYVRILRGVYYNIQCKRVMSEMFPEEGIGQIICDYLPNPMDQLER